jgi:hypothetical protein
MDIDEFYLIAPIWAYEDEEADNNYKSVTELFSLLSIIPSKRALSELYNDFYIESEALYEGDPCARIGKGDVLVFESSKNNECLIAFDMFNEATDQMNCVALYVRCKQELGDKAFALIESIQNNAERLSSIKRGKSLIRNLTDLGSYPRKVQNLDKFVEQHIVKYIDGEVSITSKKP